MILGSDDSSIGVDFPVSMIKIEENSVLSHRELVTEESPTRR
jgi:hypothetical protein